MRLAASADPFDSWLRQEAAAVLGTDPWTHLAASAAPAGHTWMSVTSELTTTDRPPSEHRGTGTPPLL